MHTFIAEYTSRCGLCDRDIEPGDEATYVDDEPVHVECAEAES